MHWRVEYEGQRGWVRSQVFPQKFSTYDETREALFTRLREVPFKGIIDQYRIVRVYAEAEGLNTAVEFSGQRVQGHDPQGELPTDFTGAPGQGSTQSSPSEGPSQPGIVEQFGPSWEKVVPQVAAQIRTFATGATRDIDATKPDYEGFLSPLVIERYGQYMNKNRVQKDGSTRASDNWQKGIPLDAYMKSGFRHFLDWWSEHRGVTGPSYQDTGSHTENLEEALCALIFNASGYLHEAIKTRRGLKEASNESDL